MRASVVVWWAAAAAVGCLLGPASGAKVLALLPFLGKSHFAMFDPLLEELSRRGHSLLVLTPFPRDPPLPANYRQISLKGVVPYLNNLMEIGSFEGSTAFNFYKDIVSLHWLLTTGYEDIFKVEGVKALLKGEEEFDVALVELFNTDMFLGVAHKLGLPVVGLSSGPVMPWAHARFANPDSPVYLDAIFSSGLGVRSFSNRLSNALGSWFCKAAYALFFDTYSQRIAEKYLGPLPPLSELAKNTSLLLVNTHFSLHKPMPLVPAIVEVGGLHVKPPKKLPVELETFMNNSKDGVIYFSMGSVLRGESWPVEKREIFLKVFSKLKQNILWKWEGEDMPNKPKNVFLSPWIPQKDILPHPKVRLFITHGGMFGITEAVHSAVPMLGIPVFGDQPMNVEAVVRVGAALSLDFNSLEEEELRAAIGELINNPKYKENAVKISQLFRDRQSSAMDTAMYWIEYVIRHKGAPHLRMEAVDLTWYEYYLLDIIGTLFLGLIIILYLTYFTIRKLFSLCCNKSEKLKKQ